MVNVPLTPGLAESAISWAPTAFNYGLPLFGGGYYLYRKYKSGWPGRSSGGATSFWNKMPTPVQVRKYYSATGTTTNKKKYKHFKTALYRKYFLKNLRWINNGYNFKFDFMMEVYQPAGNNENARQIYMKNTAEDDMNANEGQFDIMQYFYGVRTVVSSNWSQLKQMFTYYHISGIAVQYKPYMIKKGDNEQETSNHFPNLIIQMLTGQENEDFPYTNGNIESLNRQVDRPYTKIIAADDDYTMFRRFPLKSMNTTFIQGSSNRSITDPFFHWANVDQAITNANCFFRINVTEPPDPRETTWNLGTLRVSVYCKFLNSKR